MRFFYLANIKSQLLNHIFIIKQMVSQKTSIEQQGKQCKEDMKLDYSERIFKYVCMGLVVILIFCVKGFIGFRNYCRENGIYVFSTEMIQVCILSFFFVFIYKYSYFSLMKSQIQKIIHPKYTGEEKVKKVKMVLKLSYDCCYYTTTSLIALFLFRSEYWFTWAVGGRGTCGALYKDYPNWPTNKRYQLEMFFMIQLGVHGFSVFQMMVIKGKQQRKYYEFLLHHFVAASLILFSMMSNQIVAGTMILIVHDISDVVMSFIRGFLETVFTKYKVIGTVGFGLTIISWVYFRLLIFPFCLLSNVYANRPSPNNVWNIIRFEYLYLLSMAGVLVVMHIYWTYFIVKSIQKALTKNKFQSQHQAINKIT